MTQVHATDANILLAAKRHEKDERVSGMLSTLNFYHGIMKGELSMAVALLENAQKVINGEVEISVNEGMFASTSIAKASRAASIYHELMLQLAMELNRLGEEIIV